MRRIAVLAALAAALVLAGAVPRLFLAADVLPAALRPFVWSDVLYTWERGLSGGRLPYWDTYFEYPPLAGYASALFSALAPSAAVYVALWAAVQAASAALVAAVLAGTGRRAMWAWALAPQLALLGPINFDLVAVAALVLAVRWERERRVLGTTVALAVGTATKLFPAAALPVVLLRSLGTGGIRVAVAHVVLFAGIVAAAYLPAAGAPFSSLESIQRYLLGVPPNFDSLWGVVASALTGFGIDPQAPVLLVTLGGLAISYAAVVLPASARSRDPAIPVALAMLTLLLWSRLYSPQFSLWALPFFALLPLPGRALGLLIAADIAVFLTVYPLTLHEWDAGDPVRGALFAALAAAIVARHAALLLAWIAARRLARPVTTP